VVAGPSLHDKGRISPSDWVVPLFWGCMDEQILDRPEDRMKYKGKYCESCGIGLWKVACVFDREEDRVCERCFMEKPFGEVEGPISGPGPEPEPWE